MKRILTSLLVLVLSLGFVMNAADSSDSSCCKSSASCAKSTLGIFNHLGVGLGVGTNGISVEAATPITRFVSVRAGVHVMPGIKFSAEVDASRYGADAFTESGLDADFNLGRTQGSLIFNVYPFPSGSFFIAAGAYFGGGKLLKVKGHFDEFAGQGTVNIGDYGIPVDADGNISGGLKVNGFRPYLGLGWGRAIPRRLLNFNVELGVQIQGKPKVYSDAGEVTTVTGEAADNDFKDVIKYLKVYPCLTFRLTGKIF
ncbi:MAG: hypothetical protein NC212_02915 [Staphylococcus sp.]|nr:hypothetical protein [Staphylococcus sp.]